MGMNVNHEHRQTGGGVGADDDEVNHPWISKKLEFRTLADNASGQHHGRLYLTIIVIQCSILPMSAS
jgi:hypothetical protein